MPSLIKSTCEACECSYTCGLSLRKCLRLLSVIGMLSSVVYIGVGAYIIVHIVQTEKVEWFPNSYYSITRTGPTASRIVVPPPLRPIPQSNTVEDFGIHYPPQSPFQQNAIFPVGDEQDKESTNNLLEDGNERAIYYRKHVGLFICLAATLILINFIQLFTDICLFHSTLKGKRSTSFWVFFLLDVILWIMTLICFITIFSGGGIFLLLVFLVGTTIRVYIVYVLHELMSDLRKPRAWSSTTGSEVRPEPRSVVDAENGSDDDGKDGDNNADADAPQEDGDGGSTTSSTKSLQPPQGSLNIPKISIANGEDEGEDDTVVVEAQEEGIQTEDIGETDTGTGVENEELKMADEEQDGEGEADLDPNAGEDVEGGEEGELGDDAGEDEPETEEASPENPEDAADPEPEGEAPEGDAADEQPAEEETTGEEPDAKDSAEGPEEEETVEEETATEEVVEENDPEIPDEDVSNKEAENPSEPNEEDGSTTTSNEAESGEKEPGNEDIEDNQPVEAADPAVEENESKDSETAAAENPGSHNSIEVGNSENESSELPPGQENTETSEKAEETEESQADLESEERKAESEEVNEMDSGNAEEQPTQAEDEKNANPQNESKKKRKKSKRKRKNKNP